MVLLVGMLFGQSIPHALAATICDQAQFVSDLSAPDGSVFTPGAAFTKTWRLKNIGTCVWTTAYKLVFSSGDAMGTTLSVKMPVNVPAGQFVDISVNLVAPAAAGHFKGLWKLSNASGIQFGVGDSASDAFWVDINVIENKAVVYDFVANAQYAQWKSGAGPLPFPVSAGDERGFAYQVISPHLEDDSIDSTPGLLTVPQNKLNGYIQATFPEIQIQTGDQLQTLVNCEFGATGCYVTFRIDYLTPTGLQKTLWSWREAYDKRFYRATLNLNALAGQKVRFVFMLLSSGSASGDRALWGGPRIVRTGSTLPPAPPATLTSLPPLTPTPTAYASPPPTIAPAGCDKAAFVADVTIPDGTLFSPGATFIKTWRLKNSGTCTWTNAYKLVFYQGEQMGAPTSINVPWNVSPNQTVDLTVNLVAPNMAGSYRGFWILSNTNGGLFGIGADASKPVWVDVNVSGTATINTGYDFAANTCAAQWRSGSGILPCPGMDNDAHGFVFTQAAPQMEDGSTGTQSLITFPENKYNGYIQGFYPVFTVQPGDRFQTTVGCAFGSACYVTYRLEYKSATGLVTTFWTWREKNEGKTSNISVDLGPLAGRSVSFILTILATGAPTGDRAIWASPLIVRASGGGTSPTLTSVPPTSTPVGMPGTIVPNPLIRGLYMFDAYNGWAMGQGYVLRTNDGGNTWYNVLPISGGGYFPNTSRGWVLSGNILYRTTDGGRAWTQNEVPFNGGFIQFLNDANGFVLSGGPVGMFKNPVWLYQTSDGGVTWTLKYTNDPLDPNAGTSLPFGGNKTSMTFRDTLRGWVGGETPLIGFPYLYKTTDGGVTWSPQALPIPTGYASAPISVGGPKFFTANDAVLPVWISLGVGQRDLFIYVTHDGGNTWTPSTGFAREGWNADFVSVKDGFSWNVGGYLQVTHNAGGSWSQIASNVNFGDNIPGLDFVSTTTGWALLYDFNTGLTTLYRTTDGGVTWTLLTPASQSLPDLSIADMRIELQNTSCLQDGGSLGTRVWIQNNGQAAAGPFTVTVNNIPQLVNGLGVGETTALFFATSNTLVTATVDVTNVIAESNETNNTRVEIVPVPTPPLPCPTNTPVASQDLTAFGQNLVNTLNARNFDLVKLMMDQSFVFAFWQSQGTSATPDQAIQQLQANYLGVTPLVSDTGKDLNALLGGLNPYSIVGLDPNISKALFVSGWGLDGKGEALLYAARRPDGSPYWHSVLIASAGFMPSSIPPTPTAFCSDTRIPPLIEQLKGSMSQSNGDMFSALVSPVHGIDIRLWAYQPAVNFNTTSAKTIFTSTDSLSWGTGPSGSPTPQLGTFKDIIQPKLLEVLNAPNMETYCDELTKVFPLATPWPYPGVHYYNLYKPSSALALDFRTWLVGIEYVNDQPYISALVTIVWEP